MLIKKKKSKNKYFNYHLNTREYADFNGGFFQTGF